MGFLLALLFVPISLAANIFTILTSPLWAFVAALFRLEVLPWPLVMVQTHDNNIYGGPMPATFTGRWKTAVWWLCRNPSYYFDAYVLGYPNNELVDIQTRQSGTFGGTELAWAYSTIRFKNKTRFLFRADIPLIAGRYAKFWLGWHILNQAGRHMFKFDFNPMKQVRK